MKEQEVSDTYTIQMQCTNCDEDVQVKLAKGTSADGEHECPNCGCATASKKPRAMQMQIVERVQRTRDWTQDPMIRIDHHDRHHLTQPQPQFEFWCGNKTA